MRKYGLMGVAAVALFGAASGLAQAKSIKDQVPAEALAAYCSQVGVNTETMATITLDANTVLTGTVHCEAEDLQAGVSDDTPQGVEPAGSDDSVTEPGTDDEAETGDDNGGQHDESNDSGSTDGDHQASTGDSSASGSGGSEEQHGSDDGNAESGEK